MIAPIQSIYKHRFLIITLLYLILFATLFPFYQYILDDDGIGYATITRRWATGDFFRAINGLWSPLHSWLAVPFYKSGFELTTAFKVSNACISVGILGVTHKMLQKSAIPKQLQAFTLLITLPFLLYMSFYELAADILFCFLFLLYIHLCNSENAFTKTRTVIAIGIVGWLAYLSKAYAFPLFLLHFTIWQIWLFRQAPDTERRTRLWKNLFWGLSVFLLLCLPWILLLRHKYGIWTFSLNLIPMPARESYLTTPPWPDSPSGWEDPFYAVKLNWDKLSWTSLPQLPKELLHNLIALIETYNRLSFIGIAIIASLFLYVLNHQNRWLHNFLFSMIALPSGYFLLHIEERFLWPIFFLFLICGTYLLFRLFRNNSYSLPAQIACWTLFFSSFLMTPLNGLQDMMGQGKYAHELACLMKQEKLTGKFSSNGSYSLMRLVAFRSGSQYYERFPQEYLAPTLPASLSLKDVEYFYLFYENEYKLKYIEQSKLYGIASKIFHFPQHNLIVLRMRS